MAARNGCAAAGVGLSVSAVRPAMASDGALEREQLAALARQIELADRLADHLADRRQHRAARARPLPLRLRPAAPT
jgi:uncharacterized membrane protein YebE (DUF533 family)